MDGCPTTALLSHDLFEGIHGRAGLVSDVVLFEDYPARLPPPTGGACTAGCAGTGSCCRGSAAACPLAGGGRGAEPAVADLALEDRRQSAPQLCCLPRCSASCSSRGRCSSGAARHLDRLGVLVLGDCRCSARRWERLLSAHRVAALPPRHPGRLAPASDRASALWILHVAFLPHRAAVAGATPSCARSSRLSPDRHLLEWTSAARIASMLGGSSRRLLWREMAAAPLAALGTGGAARVSAGRRRCPLRLRRC